MTLADHLETLQAQIGGTRGAIQALHRESGISRPTIYKALAGRPVSLKVARSLSAATDGAVSVNALVNPEEAAA